MPNWRSNCASPNATLRSPKCHSPASSAPYAPARRAPKLEHIAAEIDLSPGSTRDVLDHWETRARLLNDVHLLLKALIRFEPQVRALIADLAVAA